MEAKIAQLKMELAELEEISSRQDLGLRIGRGIKCWMKESDWEANLPLIDWLLEVIEKLFD